MKPTSVFAMVCSILAGSLLLGPTVGSTAPEVRDGPARGHALFMAQGCYLCHGSEGQGAPSVGAALTPLRLDDAGLRRYVRAPGGSMPRYGADILSDADLTAIIAYLQSLPKPKPASAIALLAGYSHDQDGPRSSDAAATPQLAGGTAGGIHAGEGLYAQNCAACHGANREGGAGPDLRAEGRKRDAAAVMMLLLAPPPGMPKLVPDPLSEQDAKEIAAFITSP